MPISNRSRQLEDRRTLRARVAEPWPFECVDDVRRISVVRTVVRSRFSTPKPTGNRQKRLLKRVELRGFEPLTPTLPVWCATNCAIAP
jgi:hypothetical protein